MRQTTIHPSIRFPPFIPLRFGGGGYPNCHRARGKIHPGHVASLSQRDNPSHSQVHQLAKNVCVLDCEREPDYPELCTEISQAGR